MSIKPLIKSQENEAIPSGVRPSKHRWIVSVRQAYLGSYAALEDAIAVRRYVEQFHGDVLDSDQLKNLVKEAQSAGKIPSDNTARRLQEVVEGAPHLKFGALVVCKIPGQDHFIGTVIQCISGSESSVMPIGKPSPLQRVPNECLTLAKKLTMKAVI